MQLYYWNHTTAWVISRKFGAILQNTFSEEHLWRAASGRLHYNIYILSIFSFQFINVKSYLWKQKSAFKLVSLIISHTKVSKLNFHKCTHFLLFLSLSTVIIRQSHSYTKVLTLIPLIPIISLILFPDFPFRLLQIAFKNLLFLVKYAKKLTKDFYVSLH